MIIYILVHLLFVGLGIPLMRRRIRPNGLYGLRIPATFADQVVWYETNARFGRHMILIGCVGLLLSVALRWIPGLDGGRYHDVMIAWLLGSLLVTVYVDVRYANALRAQRDAG